MPDFRPAGTRSASRPEAAPQSQPIKLPETRYQRWYGRIVSAFKKIGEAFQVSGYERPKDTDTAQVFASFHHAGIHQYRSGYQRSLYDYKIAASMQLHGLARIKVMQEGGDQQIAIGVGKHRSTPDSLNSLQKTLTLTPVQLCYQFLGKGKRLPPGFLKRALHPHFEAIAVNQYGLSSEHATPLIRSLTQKVGLHDDADITFERLLELKNVIRWTLDPDSKATGKPATQRMQRSPVDPANPAISPPVLEKPGHSSYQLDNEDKDFIQTSVDNGGSLKIPKHDLRNRLKRKFLRNKRKLLFNNLAIIVSTVIAAVGTGGIAAAVNLLIYVGWYAVLTGAGEAIAMFKVVKAMQKMETSANFALNPTDMEAFKGFDDDKFRTFMKACQYVCSAETLSRIYNDYAELEKDVATSLQMADNPVTTVEDAIKFEESKARYRYRKKNLETSFELFNRLYTGAIGDMKRMEKEWDKDVGQLWQHKFKRMPPNQRAKLFNRAANDVRVTDKEYHFATDKTDWLHEIFPKMADSEEWSEIERQRAVEKVESSLNADHTGELKDSDKKKLNQQADKVIDTANLIKRGVSSYIYGAGKKTLRATASHGFKVTWPTAPMMPALEITPQLPKVSVDGLVLFGAFFLFDMLIEGLNTGINQSRQKQIQQGRKGHTGLSGRERTAREEIDTLRSMSKKDLPSFIDTLMTFHDAHKDIMEELDYHKHLNTVDPYSPPFSHMDDYEAAVLILRRKYLEQRMAQKTTGAIGEFHKQVQEKSNILSNRMTDVLVG